MKSRILLIVIAALVLTNFTAQANVTLIAFCKINDDPHKGEIKIIRDEKGLVGSYRIETVTRGKKSLLEKPSSRDVQTHRMSRKDIIDAEIFDGIGEDLGFEFDEIKFASTFSIGKEDGDNVVTLIAFKDSGNKILGQVYLSQFVSGNCLK